MASPIIIAVLGWNIQKNISSEEIKKEYVKIAVGVLTPKNHVDSNLSNWAIDILDKESPIPLSSVLKEDLRKDGLQIFYPDNSLLPESFTQQGMNKTACEEYEYTNDQLKIAFEDILKKYQKDEAFIESFKASHNAWLAFRDAELKAIYPLGNNQYEYGSVQPMCNCTILAQLTKRRIVDIKKWLDGIEEGDVCSGSIRFKSQNAD